MRTLIRPPRFTKGSRLGVIATSTPIEGLDEALIERGYRRLKAFGLEGVEAPNCRVREGHTAGSVEARVQSIHEFLRDPSIDGLMAFWGGYQTHQLLEYLDFELFARFPKPIIGYSDLTPLLNVITARTGLVTFSGPGVINFAKPTLFDYTSRYFKRALFEGGDSLNFEPASVVSTNLWYERDDHLMIERPADGWKTYRPKSTAMPEDAGASKESPGSKIVQGRLMGGNLGSLLLLAGTPYWPDLDGCILFVEEDEGETSKTIDRLFIRLRHMGVYDQIVGMVIGRFADSVVFSHDDDLRSILDVALEGYDLPVLYDVDFGHTDPLITIPIGAMGRLDVENRRFGVIEPWSEPKKS